MLIKALCDYYDVLAQSGKVLPKGYSNVDVSYLICLTTDGKIDDIIDWRVSREIPSGKDKTKTVYSPRNVVMPERTEKPGIDGNVIEHRPLYLFGLNYDKEHNVFTDTDRTNKANKSHEKFVEFNLEFVEGIDSPIVNAYRAFIQTWIPKEETDNIYLNNLGKDYDKGNYAFCLSGQPELLLHEDKSVKEKWEMYYFQNSNNDSAVVTQCAVSGRNEPIARIHNKIKGVYGGQASGCGLISFNNTSEESYGYAQSYNSNISEKAMKKYTEVLNYLIKSSTHKTILDDVTVVYWAMNANEKSEDLFSAILLGDSDKMDTYDTDFMLKSLMKDVRDGNINEERIASIDMIDPNVDFYIVGIKPNSSRLSVKFIYHRKFGEILINVARYQNDLQITEDISTIPLWRIKKELISPKSKNEAVNPALLSKLFETIIYGTDYPISLLSSMVRRVKTDTGVGNTQNRVRVGVIKACINRNFKEDFKVALDKQNDNQAYLCGRLFAVLERLQLDALGNLNRTIKDAYFASATSNPAIVFPKLIKLAQFHLNKVQNSVRFNKLIQEIMDKLNGEFPNTLPLKEQGKFIIGYYQQYQNFFVKSDNVNKEDK
ncbi:MAG: type I-C CRISPR-associated protein Cas8c/Csd1 [Lachnospiraceae bacterium]|nr:type I-C CRISPR-associated protein Cas8c/Csd1 [Lachnospiraceae bacterium]